MKPSRIRPMIMLVISLLSILVLAIVGFATYESRRNHYAVQASRVPFAVLGDSDSHAYHDVISFPEDSGRRGGKYRHQAFQWTEVLHTLRQDQIDLGQWGIWGTNGRLARLMDLMGFGGRSPRKMDFQFSFAQSGAECSALTQGRMTARLIALMDRDPSAWQRGIVLIRIGINDLGSEEALNQIAENSNTAQIQELMQACTKHIRTTVDAIQARHPNTHIVIVGLFNNAHWAPLTQKWATAAEQKRITTMVSAFNEQLRALAREPHRSFFDDVKWFDSQWGGRDSDGRANYKIVRIMEKWPTTNTLGDQPSHAGLKDGHAGTVWNLKWAQAIISHINANTSIKLPEVTDQELAQFLNAHGIQNWEDPH